MTPRTRFTTSVHLPDDVRQLLSDAPSVSARIVSMIRRYNILTTAAQAALDLAPEEISALDQACHGQAFKDALALVDDLANAAQAAGYHADDVEWLRQLSQLEAVAIVDAIERHRFTTRQRAAES